MTISTEATESATSDLASRSAAIAAGWDRLPPEYAIPEQAPSLAEAQEYCRRLARSHYENFSVASWFLPKRVERHFFSVYAYCRISDDLGDEVGDEALSLALLDQWEGELDQCYAGVSRHPVFVALAETIRACDIPKAPFANLLKAFRQDQHVIRYETFDDLLGYCENSANPVGRLVLYVCGYRDEERQRLSDFTCTALQLANFWQDVTVDWQKSRVYLPVEDLRRFNLSESDIAERRFTPAFRDLMQFEVERTRQWFRDGLPLVKTLDRELAVDIDLFSRGGLAILDAIEQQNYNVLAKRPEVGKRSKLGLLVRALTGLALGRLR